MSDIRYPISVHVRTYGRPAAHARDYIWRVLPAIYLHVEEIASLYSCPLCSGFHFTAYKLWLGHLRHVHSHDPSFHVTCGVDSCPVTYRNFSTLYSHVYRKHRHMIEVREKVIVSGEDIGRQDVAESLSQDESMDYMSGEKYRRVAAVNF